jgi:hypothetical protein
MLKLSCWFVKLNICFPIDIKNSFSQTKNMKMKTFLSNKKDQQKLNVVLTPHNFLLCMLFLLLSLKLPMPPIINQRFKRRAHYGRNHYC